MLYYQKIRAMIAQEIQDEAPFDGEIEVDERYFGGVRKGQRGRGAVGKIPVFGLLKRGGKVYAKIIPDASGKTLMPIITRKISAYRKINVQFSSSVGFYFDISAYAGIVRLDRMTNTLIALNRHLGVMNARSLYALYGGQHLI